MFEYSTAWKEVGNTLKEAWHVLDRLGFTMHRITPFGLERLKFNEPIFDSDHYCNYFAINKLFDVDATGVRKEPIVSISGRSEILVFKEID